MRIPLARRLTAAVAMLAPLVSYAAEPGDALQPPPDARLGSVSFEGAEAISKGDLRRVLGSRPRSWWRFWRAPPEFSQADVDEDAARIERFYRDRGYYSAEVVPRVSTQRGPGRMDVTYEIREGAPVRLVGLELTLAPERALPAETPDALLADLPLEMGEVFTLADYTGSRARVLARLADRGRPAATLEGGAKVDPAAREVRVAWKIDPGPPVVFGATEIEGLTDVDEGIVRRELDYVEGELYSAQALDRARSRLLALQLFRFAGVRAEPGPNTDEQARPVVWPVTIRLNERPPRSIGLGGGWRSDEGPQGRASWTHRNFLGGVRRFRLDGAASRLEQRAGASFLQPYLFGSRILTLESDLRWVRRSRDAYDTNVVDLTVGVRRLFGEHWVGEVAYRFGWTNVSNVRDQTSAVVRAQKGNGLLSGPFTRWRRVDLDKPLDPTRGTRLEVSFGPNLSALGSDFDWLRYEVDVRGFLPLGRSVATARLRARVIDPFGATVPAEVPLGERLYLGGVHTVRGFPFEKLGPLEAEGDPVGGTTSVLASVEWRVPVWRMIGAALFVDAGQVALQPWRFRTRGVGVGVGGGLTLSTPLGPVAFYAGYPVRPLAVSKTVRFGLSVGYAF